jgi:serine/threonine-protein kinase MRCK
MVGNSPKDCQLRLIPNAALDGRDLKWIKVPDTKGCHLMCWGKGATSDDFSQNHYFACAIQKTVVVFQIDRTEKRHKRVRELAMPGQPQCLKIYDGRIFVGYPSGFRIWDLLGNSQSGKKIFY